VSDANRAAEPPDLYPVFLKLAGRRVLVVGGGRVAAGRVLPLLASGAAVTVVAPEARPELEALPVRLLRRGFEPADLDGAWLVVAAATPEVNRAVAAAAEPRSLFVNAVDEPENASVYSAAILRRGGLTVALSTGGRAPALAGLLREALEAAIPEDVSTWLAVAEELRREHKARGVPMERRRPLLLEALQRVYDQRSESAGQTAAGARS